MNISIYLSVFLCYTLLSCGNTDKINDATTHSNIEQEETVRFSVSFYSIGSGIDVKSKEAFLTFIREFEAARKIKLVYSIQTWGREGENNVCFDLMELDEKGQIDFIKKSKENLSAARNVRFTENQPCL